VTILEIIEWREVINGGLAKLPEREARFLVMRYEDGMTFKEIGDGEFITKNRAQQIVAQALRKLRHPGRLGVCSREWFKRGDYLR